MLPADPALSVMAPEDKETRQGFAEVGFAGQMVLPFTSAFRQVSAACAACFSFFRVSSEKEAVHRTSDNLVHPLPILPGKSDVSLVGS